MAARRLSIRKIKEVLRLRYEKGFSNRQIAKSLDISRGVRSEITLNGSNAWGLVGHSLRNSMRPPWSISSSLPTPEGNVGSKTTYLFHLVYFVYLVDLVARRISLWLAVLQFKKLFLSGRTLCLPSFTL